MAYTWEVSELSQTDISPGDYIADFGDLLPEDKLEDLDAGPTDPTISKPGSEGKVLMLAARYAAGLPLWHDEDRYDHGPDNSYDGESETEN